MVLLSGWWTLLAAFPGPEPPTFGFRTLHKFPHDCGAFTQGLCYEQDGQVLESTGVPPNHLACTSSRPPTRPLAGAQLCRLESPRPNAGLYLESSIRRVQLRDGRVLQHEALPDEWFGEGVASHGKSCWQLLWREGLLLERQRESLELQRSVRLPQGMLEGWGITHDGANTLYASDGRHAPLLSPPKLHF